MKKQLFVIIGLMCSAAFWAVSFSGCATVEKSVIKKADEKPAANIERNKTAIQVYSDAYVVRAKRIGKLEILRFEATRKNNRDSTGVIAGTAAAITAYVLSDAYFRIKNGKDNPLATLGITAAAAYVSAAISGIIYDAVNGKQQH
jgi:hypothetical protein